MEPQSERAPRRAKIFDLVKGDVQGAAVKMTYLGEQTRPVLTVVISAEEFPSLPSLEPFVSFQHTDRLYSNDRLAVSRVSIPLATLRHMLQAAGEVLERHEPGTPRPFLSFTVLVRIETAYQGEEFLLDRTQAQKLYAAVIGSFEKLKKPVPDALAGQFQRLYPAP